MNSICLFFSFVACACGVKFKKSLSNPMSWRFWPMFSSKSLIFLGLTFRSLVHFELIFVYGIKVPNSLFCLWISSFPSSICWEEFPFPIEGSWHPYQKSSEYVCKRLSGGSPFYSTGLCVCLYASITLFLLLQLCSKFWNQEVWILHLCSAFSKLFWQFGVSWDSILALGWVSILLKKSHWEFERLHLIFGSLWIVWTS